MGNGKGKWEDLTLGALKLMGSLIGKRLVLLGVCAHHRDFLLRHDSNIYGQS